MPKLDRIKAEIAFHEKMFFGALAAMLTLIGWIVTHYLSTGWLVLALATLALIAACIFGVDQYRRVKRLLAELEKC